MPAVDTEAIRRHEMGLQRAVTAWIVTGLFFMLLPGTFLGAWNLIEIADQHTAADFDAAWLQAHGHAQIFGWIGSFILGIGFYCFRRWKARRDSLSTVAGRVGCCGRLGCFCAGLRTFGRGNGVGCCRYRQHSNWRASFFSS